MIYFVVSFSLLAAILWYRFQKSKKNSSNIKMVCNDLSEGNLTAHSQVPEKSQNVKESRCVIGNATENVIDSAIEIPATVNSLSQRNSTAHSQVAEKSQNVKNSRCVLGTVTETYIVKESVDTEITQAVGNEPLSLGIQQVNNNMNPPFAPLNSFLESRKGIESQKISSPRLIVNVSEIIKRNTKKKSPSGKSVNRKAQRTRK